MCVSADVTKEDDVANAYAEVVNQMGPLVGAINNAGTSGRQLREGETLQLRHTSFAERSGTIPQL